MHEARTAKLALAVIGGIQTRHLDSVVPITSIPLNPQCSTNTMRRARQMWNAGVIQELARVKRNMLGRNTRLRSAQMATRASVGDNDAGSLASSAESSLRARVYSDIGVGAADSMPGSKKKNGGGRGGQGRGSRGGNDRSFSAEPRYSRFALSLLIPRPKQHSGWTSADVVDSSGSDKIGGNKETGSTSSEKGKPSSSYNRSGEGGGQARKGSTERNARHSSSVTATTAAEASVAVGSKLRLDIVRADAERNTGLSPRSPRPGGDGGGSGPAGMAAAPARFDSAARELLQGNEDEQVTRFLVVAAK